VCGVSKMTLRNGETAFDDTCHNRSRTRERALSSANLGNCKEGFSPVWSFRSGSPHEMTAFHGFKEAKSAMK
jgi:hypothetical protein